MLYRLEVEFTDGSTITSPDYVRAFHDIQDAVNGGKQIAQFSAIGEGLRHDIDFSALPDNARPIHYLKRSKTWTQEGKLIAEETRQFFGYQYNGPHGTNYKEIKEI